MTILEALREGMRRLHSAKRILVWLYLLNLVVATVPTVVLSEVIRKSIDHSLAAENLRDGFDDEWHREFEVGASGLAGTFDPSVSGTGAVLNGLDAFVGGEMFSQFSGIVGVGVVFMLLWTFVNGGLVDFYLKPDLPSRERFFAASARYFPRLFRLFLLAAILYGATYYLLLPGVEKAIQTVNRQVIDERVAFAWVLAKYALVLAIVFLINLVFDYAKVLTVLEERRSAVGAAWSSLVFTLRHPIRTVGLYAAIGAVGISLLLLYGLVAPGALQQSYWTVAFAFALGQIHILGRIWTRLLFLSSQSALCQNLRPRRPGPGDD